MEYVLWGRKANEQEWEEQLITSTESKEHLAKAKAWAKANGFVKLRVSHFAPGDKPDFAGTINR